MNIDLLIKNFPNEDTCKENLRKHKEGDVIACKNCGCQKHYWLKAKWQWQCSECKSRTTLRSGTIMENSKLIVQIWYLVMAIVVFCDEKISVSEIQRKLGHSRYESIWNMSNRIRDHMEHDGDMYNLFGLLNIKRATEKHMSELKKVE